MSRASALRSPDWPARVTAVRRCAEDPAPGSVRLFCTVGYDPDDRVRLAWDLDIDRLADRAGLDWLAAEGRTHPDRAVRYVAWRRWLASPMTPARLEDALSHLEDNFEEVQYLVFSRLAASAPPELRVINAARYLVRPRYSLRIRRQALRLLSLPGDFPHAIAAVQAAVEEHLDRERRASEAGVPASPPDWTFERDVERLGVAGLLPETVTTLAGLAEQIGTALPSSDMTSSRAAKEAEIVIRLLARSGESGAVAPLLCVARSGWTPSLRREAILGLASLRHPIRDERLVEMLREEPDADLRRFTAWTLRGGSIESPVRDALTARRGSETDWRLLAALDPGVPGSAPRDARNTSIAEALGWLCRAQEADGRWSSARWNPHFDTLTFSGGFGTSTPAGAREAARDLDAAVTAMALLAFLAAPPETGDDPAVRAAMAHAAAWLVSWRGGSPDAGSERDRPRRGWRTWALAEARRRRPEIVPEETGAVDFPGAGSIEELALRASALRAGSGDPAAVRSDLSAVLQPFTAAALHGAVPSTVDGSFWFSGLGSSARAVVLASWCGTRLETGGNAATASWLGAPPASDTSTLASLAFHHPVWASDYEILGPQRSVPDAVWPLPRSDEFAPAGVALFPAWEDDLVDLDAWLWEAMAADLHRGEPWADAWRASLERVLGEEQRLAGAERGSWDPEGPWERATGRVGATALGALALSAPDRRLEAWKK